MTYRSEVAFTTGLRPIRQVVDFNGRSPRSDMVAFLILWWFVSRVVGFFLAGAVLASLGTGMFTSMAIFQIACGAPLIGLFIRRLHDQDRSGRWVLLLVPIAIGGLLVSYEMDRDPFAPFPFWVSIAGIIMSIFAIPLAFFAFARGTDGPNRFGDEPE